MAVTARKKGRIEPTDYVKFVELGGDKEADDGASACSALSTVGGVE
jgi:hypothetical protein